MRGSGTTELVFSFTVPSGLKDEDGIELYSGPLRLNGGTITAVSDGISAVWNLAAEKNIGGKVDSSQTFSGGVCDRTLQVRNAILSKVATNDNNVSNCSQVTETHLAAVTGVLLVNGLTSLAAGDFAGLSGNQGDHPRAVAASRPCPRACSTGSGRARRIGAPDRADPSAEGLLPGARQARRSQPERKPARRRQPAGRYLRAADEAD